MINKLCFDVANPTLEELIFSKIETERETLGYYNLPNQDISEILSYGDSISEDIKNIVVIGIGGSSLGAKAIYEFIKPVQKLKRRLYFFESTDPNNIKNTLKNLDLNSSHFVVISKSGSTVETFAIYKYILSLQPNHKYYTFITDPNSNLEKYANSIDAKVFNLDISVGGRFSVLSSVGLVPLSMCGVDISSLLDGAKKISCSFFEDGYIKEPLLTKAIFYAKNHDRYNINCLFAYSESLQYFCDWYVQLWGESLGKNQKDSVFNVGLTPIGLIGPKDQHSFLQLIVQGNRDKSVTFIQVEDFDDNIKIPDISLKHLEGLDILNNISFSDLINMQCNSVTQALKETKDIPVDTIVIEKIDEFNIGSLIYYYELLTSLVGVLMNVDTYNQPGVESAKIILKDKIKNTND